jgi:carboxylesterase type B
MSVGLHLTAYNGRDDGLFRAAIMDSGGPLFSSAQSRSLQPQYDNITRQTGCASFTDTLQCLRSLPFEQLNSVINTTGLSGAFGPRIDNDLIFTHSSVQLANNRFVHVPIIIGANSDEGTSFSPQQINTTEDFEAALKGKILFAS